MKDQCDELSDGAPPTSGRKSCLDRRRESSRYAARDRRGKEADIFVDLKEVVPIVDEASAATHVDRIALLRVAATLCRMRRCAGNFLRKLRKPPVAWCDNDEDAVVLEPAAEAAARRRCHDADVWTEEGLAECLDGFALLADADGTILYVTESINFIIGLTQTDLVGRHLKEFVHVADYEELSRAILAAELSGGDGATALSSDFDAVLRMKTIISPRGRTLNFKSALYKAIMCHCNFVADDNFVGDKNAPPAAGGHRLMLLYGAATPAGHGALLNVSALKANKTANGVFSTRHTCDMRFTYVSDNFNLLLRHVNAKSLLGTSLYDLVHAADLERLAASMRQLSRKSHTLTPYYRLLGAYGAVIWCQTEATTVTHITRGQKRQYVLCVHTIIGTQSELESWNTPANMQMAAECARMSEATTELNAAPDGCTAAKPFYSSIKMEIPDVAEYFGRQPEFIDCTDFTPLIESSAAALTLTGSGRDYRPTAGYAVRQIQPELNVPRFEAQTPPPASMPPPARRSSDGGAKLPPNSSYNVVLQWLFQDEDIAGLPPAPDYLFHSNHKNENNEQQQQHSVLSRSLDRLDGAASSYHVAGYLPANGAARAAELAGPLQYVPGVSLQQQKHQQQHQGQQQYGEFAGGPRGRSVDGGYRNAFQLIQLQQQQQQAEQQVRYSRYDRFHDNNMLRQHQQKSQSIDSNQHRQMYGSQPPSRQTFIVRPPRDYNIPSVPIPEYHIVSVDARAVPAVHAALPAAYRSVSAATPYNSQQKQQEQQCQQQQHVRLREQSQQQFYSFSPVPQQQQQQIYQQQLRYNTGQQYMSQQQFQQIAEQQIHSCLMTSLSNNISDYNKNAEPDEYGSVGFGPKASPYRRANPRSSSVCSGYNSPDNSPNNNMNKNNNNANNNLPLNVNSLSTYKPPVGDCGSVLSVRSVTPAMSLNDFAGEVCSDAMLTSMVLRHSRPASECEFPLYGGLDKFDKELQECEQLGAGLAPFLPQEDMQELLDADGPAPGSSVEELHQLFPDFDPAEFVSANHDLFPKLNFDSKIFAATNPCDSQTQHDLFPTKQQRHYSQQQLLGTCDIGGERVGKALVPPAPWLLNGASGSSSSAAPAKRARLEPSNFSGVSLFHS